MGYPIVELVQSRSSRPENGGGTWVHPKVAIHLAQWLDPKFAPIQRVGYYAYPQSFPHRGWTDYGWQVTKSHEFFNVPPEIGKRLTGVRGEGAWNLYTTVDAAIDDLHAAVLSWVREAAGLPQSVPAAGG